MTSRHLMLVAGLLPALLLHAAVPAVTTDQVGPAPSLTNTPGMRGLVHGFFDDRTGERNGRLRIESVEVEYRRQGFLRVAWRPLVVLAGVNLEIEAVADWPATGRQILAALQSAGGREAWVLRNVRLRLAGSPNREILAPTAAVRSDGGLELRSAVFLTGGETAQGGPQDLCLWLAGPQVGQLTPPPPSAAGVVSAQLVPSTSDQLSR
jgi:hypothetical protein